MIWLYFRIYELQTLKVTKLNFTFTYSSIWNVIVMTSWASWPSCFIWISILYVQWNTEMWFFLSRISLIVKFVLVHHWYVDIHDMVALLNITRWYNISQNVKSLLMMLWFTGWSVVKLKYHVFQVLQSEI